MSRGMRDVLGESKEQNVKTINWVLNWRWEIWGFEEGSEKIIKELDFGFL